MLLPYARRWTRGIDRDTESHHVLIPIRDQLDRMTEDQWQRDTTSASHGEEGDPLFEHVRARGTRRERMGHRGRARGYALGRGAGGIPIPPDIEAETRDVEGIGRMSYESTIDVGDYLSDIAIHTTGPSSTVEESDNHRGYCSDS
uniref:Uncharacterized protein n=1 Tax=Solanum lycopersicum TaxID=4081 RepID=A0A3Q7I256_SOLLC